MEVYKAVFVYGDVTFVSVNYKSNVFTIDKVWDAWPVADVVIERMDVEDDESIVSMVEAAAYAFM